MALVAYDNSDSSDFEEEDEKTDSVSIIGSSVPPPPLKEELTNSMNLSSDIFKSLLPPSRQKFLPAEEEDDEFLRKKAFNIKPKTKIMVPSLNDFQDVGGTSQNKPKGVNGKKSGLLSMLPDPKNGLKMSIKPFIPHAVSKKLPAKKLLANVTPKSVKPIEAKPVNNITADNSDEDSENEDGTDFFSINKKYEIIDEEPIESAPKVLYDDTSVIDSNFIESENNFIDNEATMDSKPDYIEVTNPAESSELQLDEEAIRQLCGSRGRRNREEIQILNINQQEVLEGAREMLMKNIMDESQPTRTSAKRKGNGPTSQQKRKHQITYLAYQAKANEAELQNQWAQNRVSKRQTQSKYGF